MNSSDFWLWTILLVFIGFVLTKIFCIFNNYFTNDSIHYFDSSIHTESNDREFIIKIQPIEKEDTRLIS